ncbi:L,D-transpeptidase [Devosia sp.]|jgi:lipoprotein-anchoring transpeptidase ErfK/SrfK|uniref:L,D-transpeptidase n=1 Tax=Devosia sp. TaxID=1871048 RepID=UPI0025B82821|nr:L,D-transpeptidase [Devosia sp.]
MDRRKFTVAALAALVGVAATPAMAKLYYNPDTNKWEEREASAGGRSFKRIDKEIVPYETKFKVGTIVVETGERRLYLILPDGKALKYGIGVGRDGFTWSGQHRISRKAEWPDWTPPAAMRKRVPDLPAHMKGGPQNPLGARALYIGSTLYRIHGTSEPWTIGQAVSSGCIRLTNEDVIDLYERAQVGALVVVHH